MKAKILLLVLVAGVCLAGTNCGDDCCCRDGGGDTDTDTDADGEWTEEYEFLCCDYSTGTVSNPLYSEPDSEWYCPEPFNPIFWDFADELCVIQEYDAGTI